VIKKEKEERRGVRKMSTATRRNEGHPNILLSILNLSI